MCVGSIRELTPTPRLHPLHYGAAVMPLSVTVSSIPAAYHVEFSAVSVAACRGRAGLGSEFSARRLDRGRRLWERLCCAYLAVLEAVGAFGPLEAITG